MLRSGQMKFSCEDGGLGFRGLGFRVYRNCIGFVSKVLSGF